ncbi:MAG: hypothetical protein HZC26_03240 [Candidatus Magasanikbacteria bacterium]|nr:hypothetical protein [Candidatus Magasanikbacteria bacterium]
MLEHPPNSNLELANPTWGRDDFLFAPADLAKESAGDSQGSETKGFNASEYFLETVTEVTKILFERAIKNGDVWLAFTQVRDSQKYGLPHYLEIRDRLVSHIDDLLARSDSELVDGYRTLLRSFKKEIEESTFAGNFLLSPAKKPRRPSPEQDPEYLRTLKEITPDLFETMVERREVGWAFEHLKRASVLGLEDYPAMKKRFLALLDLELEKSEQQIKEEYRRRLKEMRDCLLDECWTAGTVQASYLKT